MKLRRLKHMLLRLSTEEKVLGIGALMVLVGAFLPWYSVIFSYEEKSIFETGFSGHLGVIGFVIFLLTLLSVTFLIADHISIKLPKFGLKKEQIIMFLMGESAFLILLMVAINIKRSLEYTNAELRFGLYLSLIGSLVGAFSAFSQIQKNQKKDVEAFFGQAEEEVEAQAVTEVNDTVSQDNHLDNTEAEPVNEIENVIKDPIQQVEQKSFFYEENAEPEDNSSPEINNELDDEEEEPYQETKEVEQIDEDEMVEGTELEVADEPETEVEAEEKPEPEVEDEPEAEIEPAEEEPEVEPETEGQDNNPDKTEEITNEESSDQADYFIREAGVANESDLKVDMESIKKVKKAEKDKSSNKEPANENLSIYDDM